MVAGLFINVVEDLYRNLDELMMNLSGSSLKEGGGRIFMSCDFSLENTPTSHAVNLALVICACNDSAMPLLSCACLRNNSNGACLPSPLLRCFLLNQHVLRHN